MMFPTSTGWNVSYVPSSGHNLDVTIFMLLHFSWSPALVSALRWWGHGVFGLLSELGCYSTLAFKYEMPTFKVISLVGTTFLGSFFGIIWIHLGCLT